LSGLFGPHRTRASIETACRVSVIQKGDRVVVTLVAMFRLPPGADPFGQSHANAASRSSVPSWPAPPQILFSAARLSGSTG
jgi:hypothetical protein